MWFLEAWWYHGLLCCSDHSPVKNAQDRFQRITLPGKLLPCVVLPPLDRSLFLCFAALQYGRSIAQDLAASRDLPETKMARLWLCVSLSLCSFVTHSCLAPFRLMEKLLLQAVRVQTYILRMYRLHRLGGYASAASMTHLKVQVLVAGLGGRNCPISILSIGFKHVHGSLFHINISQARKLNESLKGKHEYLCSADVWGEGQSSRAEGEPTWQCRHPVRTPRRARAAWNYTVTTFSMRSCCHFLFLIHWNSVLCIFSFCLFPYVGFDYKIEFCSIGIQKNTS